MRAQLPLEEWEERLALEYSLVLAHEPTFDTLDGNLQRYQGVVMGSDIYEGGFFKIEIVLPREFPYSAPKVHFLTKIWHPNITASSPAKVCETILQEHWSPALHVFSIIEALRALLSYPNPRSPLNAEAANQIERDPRAYKKKVSEYVEQYAFPEQAFRPE